MSDRHVVNPDALVVARFWLRSLDECDCPPEHYPTGDVRTLHEPYCSTTLKDVASALVAASRALDPGPPAHHEPKGQP